MEITIFDEIKIENIPSGSGIIKFKDLYYIIGDDSPFLYSLDKDFNTVSKTPIWDSVNASDERIEKSIKPDFEALELIGKNEIVIFGSGSKSPERNIFMRILLKDSLIIEKYDVSEFYNSLRSLSILQDSELNIEAAAFHGNQLFLFNRKKNLIIGFVYKALLAYIKGDSAFPEPEIMEFSLPKINGIEAGFSGATALIGEPKILFTASVENTDNAYDDGEILGSFIGIIDISGNDLSKSYNFCQIPNSKANLKVESVSIEEEISSGKTKIILISDDDKGNSTLITALLSW